MKNIWLASSGGTSIPTRSPCLRAETGGSSVPASSGVSPVVGRSPPAVSQMPRRGVWLRPMGPGGGGLRGLPNASGQGAILRAGSRVVLAGPGAQALRGGSWAPVSTCCTRSVPLSRDRSGPGRPSRLDRCRGAGRWRRSGRWCLATAARGRCRCAAAEGASRPDSGPGPEWPCVTGPCVTWPCMTWPCRQAPGAEPTGSSDPGSGTGWRLSPQAATPFSLGRFGHPAAVVCGTGIDTPRLALAAASVARKPV